MGIMHSRYEGVILVAPSHRFVRLMLLPIDSYFRKALVQSATGSVWSCGFAAACAKMLACRPRLHGVNNSKQGVVDTPF